MTTIKIKRLYEEPAKSDGFRVLVDRLWPRGVKKGELQYNLWAKEMTPSPELRKWWHEDPEERWEEFARKYRKELEHDDDAVDEFLKKIETHKTVTLIYGAKNETRNHALILKKFLETVLDHK